MAASDIHLNLRGLRFDQNHIRRYAARLDSLFDYRHIPHPPILLCPAHSAHSTSGPRYLCISANRCGIPWNKHTDMVFDIPLNRSRPYSDIQRTEVWELRTIRVLHDRNVRRRSPDVDKLVLPAE